MDTQLGNKLIEWTELNAPLILNSYPIIPIDGGFKQALNEIMNDEVPTAEGAISLKTAFDVAIDAAVGNAADSRPQIMDFMKRADLAEVLRDEMLKNIPYDAPEPETPPVHVIYPHARYNPVREKIIQKLTPPALPAEKFAGYGEIPGGTTATEQEGNTIKIERVAASKVATMLTAMTTADLDDPAIIESLILPMRHTILRFVADVPEDKTAEDYISNIIYHRTAHKLTPGEKEALDAITSIVEPDPSIMGFNRAREVVGAYIKEFQEAQPPLDLKTEGEEYGKDFRAPTLLGQLKVVNDYAEQIVKENRGKVTVKMVDDLFAHDRRLGTGYTIDNTVGWEKINALPGGQLHEQQRAEQNNGKPTDMSLLNTLGRDPMAAAEAWTNHVTERFIYPYESRDAQIATKIKEGVPREEAEKMFPIPDYRPQRSAQGFMSGGYGEHVRVAKTQALVYQAAQEQAAAKKKAE
jgi:hypothetical protein